MAHTIMHHCRYARYAQPMRPYQLGISVLDALKGLCIIILPICVLDVGQDRLLSAIQIIRIHANVRNQLHTMMAHSVYHATCLDIGIVLLWFASSAQLAQYTAYRLTDALYAPRVHPWNKMDDASHAQLDHITQILQINV
jgi:hypothetical protein